MKHKNKTRNRFKTFKRARSEHRVTVRINNHFIMTEQSVEKPGQGLVRFNRFFFLAQNLSKIHTNKQNKTIAKQEAEAAAIESDG